jgi:hypothetical protein
MISAIHRDGGGLFLPREGRTLDGESLVMNMMPAFFACSTERENARE